MRSRWIDPQSTIGRFDRGITKKGHRQKEGGNKKNERERERERESAWRDKK